MSAKQEKSWSIYSRDIIFNAIRNDIFAGNRWISFILENWIEMRCCWCKKLPFIWKYNKYNLCNGQHYMHHKKFNIHGYCLVIITCMTEIVSHKYVEMTLKCNIILKIRNMACFFAFLAQKFELNLITRISGEMKISSFLLDLV